MKEIVAECKPYKKSHICQMNEFLEDAYNHVEAQIYMERKMYDHMVKFCMHTLYRAEENLEKYAKYMSEADQRLVAQDIIERMKLRAPECKRGDDYDHFAGWIRRLYNSSPGVWEDSKRGSGGDSQRKSKQGV